MSSLRQHCTLNPSVSAQFATAVSHQHARPQVFVHRRYHTVVEIFHNSPGYIRFSRKPGARVYVCFSTAMPAVVSVHQACACLYARARAFEESEGER
eukprot:2590276-Rhodomonas_salina.1